MLNNSALHIFKGETYSKLNGVKVFIFTLLVFVISIGFSNEGHAQRTSKPKKTPKVQGKSPASASGKVKFKRRTIRPRNSAPKGFKERKVAPRNSVPKAADRTRVQTRKPSSGGKFKFRKANAPRSIDTNPRVRRSDVKKYTKLPMNSASVFGGRVKRKKSSNNSSNVAAKGPFGAPRNGKKYSVVNVRPRSTGLNSSRKISRRDAAKMKSFPTVAGIYGGNLKRKKSGRNSNNVAAKGPFHSPGNRKKYNVINVSPRSTGLNSSRRISRRDAARMKSFPTIAGIYSGNIKRKKSRGSNIKGPFRAPSGNRKYEVINVRPRSIRSNSSLKISRRDGVLARSLPSIATIHGGNIKVKKGTKKRRYVGTSSRGNIKAKWSKGKDYPDTRTIGLVTKKKDVTKKTTRIQADFIGHTKLKYKKKKGMHPSYVFKMGSLKKSHDKKEATRKRWKWLHHKQKNIDQPKAVKEKVKKPRYDAKERDIWIKDRSKAGTGKKKDRKKEKIKQGEQEEEKQE